jgi:NADPH-dependent curcumin reductase CurA
VRRTGYPEPGKTTITDSSEKIDLDAVALEGGALIKVLALSIDPYMRGRMREEHIQSYVVRLSGLKLHNRACADAHRTSRPSRRGSRASSAYIRSPLPDIVNRITNGGVGKVLRSENPKFKQGDYVYGTLSAFNHSPGVFLGSLCLNRLR